VGQVDGKTIAANPHEQLVGEEALQRRRKPDPSDHEIPPNGGEALRVAGGALRNDPVSEVLELDRPGRPLPVLSGEARHIPAEDDEESGSESTGLDAVVDKVTEALL